MSNAEWYGPLEKVKKYVVHISTPGGSGTGFLIASSKEKKEVGIATAFHVISYAVEWGQPIKIRHEESSKTILLKESDRLIHYDDKIDSALIGFSQEEPPFPDEPLILIERGKRYREGVEIGWCGYPAVYPTKLCFFSGCISAWLENENAYLVDGVAINGVSGGPAFTTYPTVMGFVTAYIPNRVTGEALPGVALIRSIKYYIDLFDEQKLSVPKAKSS